MKLACLILAHKNIEQLMHLCSVLLNNNIYIFVHIDKKWNISEDEIKALAYMSQNIYVSDKRYSTYIDHKSLVEATLHLCKLAKDSISPSYYILLSGQDYMIKSVVSFKKKLFDEYPRPFIDCTPYDVSNWMYYKYKNSELYNCFLHKLRTSNVQLLNKIERRLHKWRFGNHNISLFKKLRKFRVDLYGGSAWWILPDIAVDEIFEDINSNPQIVKLLNSSFTPEESFFQTMIMRTSLKSSVEINDVLERRQNCLTYANFETPSKPFKGHPYIITSDDWIWLKDRPEYFARKFDFEVDKKIFDIIDSFI